MVMRGWEGGGFCDLAPPSPCQRIESLNMKPHSMSSVVVQVFTSNITGLNYDPIDRKYYFSPFLCVPKTGTSSGSRDGAVVRALVFHPVDSVPN